MTAKLLVLSGASGVGKTSLASHLISTTASRWVHLEADRMAASMSDAARSKGFSQAEYLEALIKSMLCWHECGFNALIDGVLPYPEDELYRRCVRLLRNQGALFAAVSAPYNVVEKRISARGRGSLEWAARQLCDINSAESMDFSVDASAPYNEDPGVQQIIRWMNE